MANDASQLQGLSGACYLDSTNNLFGGRSRGLLVVNDAVLDDVACEECINHATLVGLTLPAGLYLPGVFTSVLLATGVVCLPHAQSGNVVDAV